MADAVTKPLIVFRARYALATLAIVSLWGSAAIANAIGNETRALSETVYVPAYSHIHTHQKVRQALASTLVVHNADPEVEIEVLGVRYHDRDGKLVRAFLDDPVTLKPFQSSNYLTQISESAGGVGANYIVEWRAAEPAISPIIEAVMIGGSGTQGISFISPGRVILREAGIEAE
jgi:hypothetical protein